MAGLHIKEVLQNLAGSWQSHVTRKKAYGGWRHDNSFLSLDTTQEGQDNERVLEKRFDIQLINICAYAI